MKKRGRRTLLTVHLRKRLCELLSAGNTVKTSCAAVGVSERSFFDWCEQKPHFAQATNRARSQAKIKLVRIITAAAPLDWRAASFLLERGWPNEYGKVWREPASQEEKPIPVNFFVQQDDGTVVETPYAKLPKKEFPIVRQCEPANNDDGTDDHDDDDVSFDSLRRNRDSPP
jgi:hypothetical protein